MAFFAEKVGPTAPHFTEDVGAAEDYYGAAAADSKSQTDNFPMLYIGLTEGQLEPLFERPNSVGELASLPSCDLRIIFAPLDRVKNPRARNLFEHLKVPSQYVLEVEQFATSSFGYRSLGHGEHCIWFHFLCKNIPVDQNSQIKSLYGKDGYGNSFSQADSSWYKSGFFLCWNDAPSADTRGRSESVASSSTGEIVEDESMIKKKQESRCRGVTICCWGATESLQIRFANIARDNQWDQALEDPFLLVDVILEDLYKTINRQMATVKHVLGRIEKETFDLAKKDADSSSNFDFVGLANVSKHIIHLGENCNGLADTAAAISQRHHLLFDQALQRPSRKADKILIDSTNGGLAHKQTLIRSTQMRISSLEKRTQNITNLAFNFVNQANSIKIKQDSDAMQKIARVTLAMLPIATVGALFSTPFFTLNDASKITVSSSFWIFWVISVPLTLIIMNFSTVASYTKSRLRKLESAQKLP